MHANDDIDCCGKTPTGPEGHDRRTFLTSSVLATGAFALGGPLGARAPVAAGRPGTATKVTVVLFQRGGADNLNLYAPTGDANYALLRPTIGITPPGQIGTVVGLPMNATFSMNPALAGVHAAYTAPASSAGIVHAVGYQRYNRSHFESQDLYETALQAGAAAEGWINRHLQVTAAPGDAPVRGLALTGALPRSMYGTFPCFAVGSTADLAFLGLPDSRLFLEAITDSTPTGGMLPQQQLAYQSGADAFDLIDLFASLHPTTYVPANGAVYPAGALGKALREVAEAIKADLGVEIFAVDHNGWDHHAGLVARIGTLATELNQAITAFFTDLGAASSDVALVTMSEFGREVQENGSAGTDHGVGGAMLVMGGPTNGGQVHGVWPGLANAALEAGRFLAPSNDFRDVLREVLDVHMGGTDPGIVFPSHTYTPIGVM
ncbi:MAG: DUF1501 domain-containing protein [Planctomycetota bacterium]